MGKINQRMGEEKPAENRYGVEDRMHGKGTPVFPTQGRKKLGKELERIPTGKAALLISHAPLSPEATRSWINSFSERQMCLLK